VFFYDDVLGINNRSYQCPRQLGGVVVLLLPVTYFGSRVQHDAPSALRGLFFHSRHVARWCVQRLPPPLLPSSCRVHCPYLLFCFFYHDRSVGIILPLTSIDWLLVVVQSFSRRIAAY
jgi:hypothetical protein